MTHRFEDLHDCKPIIKEEQYEKIKRSNSFFNWNKGSKKDIKKDKSDDE